MKGKLLHLFATVSMLCFYFGASAQNILSQDWSSSTFPPTGWTVAGYTSSGGSTTSQWQRTLTGITNPTSITPYSSPGMAGYNSWNISSGYYSDLISPAMNFSTYGSTGSNQVTVTWYKYGSVSSYTDNINLYINTSASVSGATNVGTLYESLLSSPTASAAGWYSYTFSIPASYASSSTVYLIIRATSAFGYDMLMDNISVDHIPPCSGTPSVSISKLPYVCSGKSFTLTATVPLASGMLYQWQIATSATGPWSNISGETNLTYTSSGITGTRYYRFKDSCTASGNNGYSNVDTVAIAPAALCPCDVQYYYPLYSSTTPSCTYTITNFQITGDGTSGFTDGAIPCVLSTYGGYDRTFDTVKMTQTGTYSGNITYSYGYYGGYAIWVDFNDDGTFSSTERLFFTSAYSPPITFPSSFSITIPATAPTGPHRMRVRFAYTGGGPSSGATPAFNNPIDPCTYTVSGSSGTDNYYYGAARDYVVNVQAAPPCTGTPSLTITTVPSVCSGGTITLTATPSPKLALGYFYQWQQASSPTGPWSNISGANNPTFTSGAITAATYFRCQLLCTNSGFTGTSNVDTTVLKVAALCPCNVLYYYGTPGYTGGTACTYNISNFTITAVNTITEGALTCVTNGNGYDDRTVIAADTINMYRGGNYNGSITTSYGYYVAAQIWIDYNDDGTFSNTEAQMPTMMNGAYISKTAYPYRLYIPANAPLGPHRMRIRYAYTSSYYGPTIWVSLYSSYILDPCNYTYTNSGGNNIYYYGSTRDYEIKIINPATACTGTPAAATITPAGPQSLCAGVRDTLYMTSAIQNGYSYQWQTSTNGGSTWSNISGATSTMYNFAVSSSAWYRMLVTCSNSGLSAPSNIVVVNLAPAQNCQCSSPTALQYYYEYLYGYNPCSSYYISRVQVAGATTMNDVYSTCLGWGYEDRVGIAAVANILQGGTATWTLGFSGSSTSYMATIWIDYNDDGTFASSEIIDFFNVNSTTMTRPAVTIPASAPTGIHRMRVRFCYTSSTAVSALDPCAYSNPSGTYNYYGDAHDYYVNVISNTPTPTLSPSTTQNLCVGQTISITATTTATGPTFTYNWTGPNGYTSSTTTTSTTNTITIPSGTFAMSGPYYCRVISSSAPSSPSAPAIDSVFVWPYPNFVASVTSNSPICTPNPITLNGIGNPNNITYSWSGPNSFTSTSATPTIATSTTAMGGTYTVTLNNRGCTTVGTTNVTVYQTPAIVSATKTDPTSCTCNCGFITLTGLNASTTYTVNYTRNGVAVGPISKTTDASGNLVINGLNAAIYDKINVTLNNCPSPNVGPLTLNNPSTPPTPTVGSNSPVCFGYPISFTGSVSSSLNWSWSGPGGYTYSSTGTTSNPTKTSSATFADSGNYYVYVTDGAGCTGAVQVLNVVVKPSPNAPTVASNNAALPGGLCEGQTLTLTMGTVTPPGTPAGISYRWTDPRGSTTNPSTSATYSSTATVSVSNITNNFAGNWVVYSVLNGCASASPTNVYTYIKWKPGTPNITSNSPVCSGVGYNANNIILSASDTSLSPALNYTWSGPNGYSASAGTSPTQTISNPPVAASGTYTVFASLLGCNSASATTSVTVNQTPGQPVVAPSFTTYCQKDVAVPLTATGTNLLWHTSSTGTVGSATAPTPSTSIAGLFFWYVTQTTNYTGISCEGPGAADSVLVKTKPTVPYAVSSIDYCQGDIASRLTAIGANLLWYTSATGGVGSPVQPIPSTATPGVFMYYVTQTINGCESDRFAITVNVKAKPPKPNVAMKEYCQNEFALPLSASGTNLMWYRTSSGGVGSPIAPTPITSYADTLFYYVTQTINGCQSDRAELLVVVNYTPNALIVTNQPYVCQYDSIYFTYYGNALKTASYNWTMPNGASLLRNSGGQGPIWVKFDSAGKQVVTLQVTNKKCKSPVTSYVVDVRSAPYAPTNIKSEVCQDQIMDVSLGYANQHIDKYDWNFDGAEVVYGSEGGGPFGIRWHTAGEHVVKFVAYTNTCPSLPQYDTVTVHPLADAHIGDVSSSAICAGDSVQFTAERYNPAYLYTWTPSIYFGTQTNSGKVYGFIEHTGAIRLSVTTQYGCTSTDSTMITAQPCCEVYFPNAFTPNGDGKNDVFRPVSKGNQVIKTFRVTNRWGQVMFETVNPRIGWDGRFNGALQDLGTYYYFIRYMCANGKVYEEKGEVLLIK